MSKPRTMPDGSLAFPIRGKPPEFNHPYYERDPRDPFRFLPKFPPCIYKDTITKYRKDCDCTTTIHWCKLFDHVISVPFCAECTSRQVVETIEVRQETREEPNGLVASTSEREINLDRSIGSSNISGSCLVPRTIRGYRSRRNCSSVSYLRLFRG